MDDIPAIEAAQRLGFETSTSEAGDLRLHHPALPITVGLDAVGEASFAVHLYCRTLSDHWDGHRADLNDATSLVVAAYLAHLCDVSPLLLDVPHPVLDEGLGNVYARYVVFGQPALSVFGAREGEDGVHKIVTALWAAGRLMHDRLRLIHVADDEQRYSSGDPDARAFGQFLADRLNVKDREPFWSCRQGPDWLYFGLEDGGLSAFHSTDLARFFRVMSDRRRADASVLPGVDGDLVVTPATRACLPHAETDALADLMRELEPGPDAVGVHVLAMENRLVVAGEAHVVVQEVDCGMHAAATQVELVRRRHQKESELLFASPGFDWPSRIDGARFEGLIGALLRVEPDVVDVRAVGKTNEPDAGRDLMLTRVTPLPPGRLTPDGTPFESHRMAVQCKAVAKGAGRDIVANAYSLLHGRGLGYWLVSSTTVSASAIDELERLGASLRLPVLWWSRDEIEQRLRRNPEILAHYPDVVRPR